jgi:hypothetical protein
MAQQLASSSSISAGAWGKRGAPESGGRTVWAAGPSAINYNTANKYAGPSVLNYSKYAGFLEKIAGEWPLKTLCTRNKVRDPLRPRTQQIRMRACSRRLLASGPLRPHTLVDKPHTLGA